MDQEVVSTPSTSDSTGSLRPINVCLDFDPVEFQAAALRTITKYACCADAYSLWVSLSDDLKGKLVYKLDTSVLRVQEQVTATSWVTWSPHEMEDFREGARMKLLIGAYDEFNSQNPGMRQVEETEWAPEHLLRMDIKIATFRLTRAMTQLINWANSLDDKRGDTPPLDRPIQQRSLVTFTFSSTSVTRFKQTYHSHDILDRGRQPEEIPRVKKGRKSRSRCDENFNKEAPPDLPLCSSSIWGLKRVGPNPNLGVKESSSSLSSELSLGEVTPLNHQVGSPPFSLCPSDQSFVGVGEGSKVNPKHPACQIYTMGVEVADLNENPTPETKKTHRRGSKKRTREEAAHVSTEESSSGSWVTVGSSSCSPEEGGEHFLERGRPIQDYYNGNMDALEMGEYLKEYDRQDRQGSRDVYWVFFGAIFITIGIAGIIATAIALVRTYFYS